MAISAYMYGNNVLGAYNKEIDWDTDTIKVALLTESYTPAQTHDFYDDLTNEVANGNGYTTGGATLGSKTQTYTTGTGVTKFDAADSSWTSATFTFRYAAVYVATGNSATSRLIGYVDFGENITIVSGTVTIPWAATGLFTFTNDVPA
jgi:hypothetical protein